MSKCGWSVPVLGLLTAAAGALLSWAVFFPQPPLSPRVRNWRDQGAFYNYNGHNVFYMDVAGEGSRGVVICLHGFPTFSLDWYKVLPGLRSQFARVVLLDFLGFGLSDKPVSHIYSVVDQAHLVSHLARHLGVGGAHLLSHDYGDSVALELLARFNLAPEGREGGQSGGEREGIDATPTPLLTVQSLTMLNGGVFPETNIPRPLQKVLLIPVLGPLLSRLTCRPLFRLGFGEIFGRNKPTEEEYLDFYSAIVHHSGHHVTASLLQYIPERQRNKDRWVGALRNSRVPVLMIYGPADPVNPSPHFPDMFWREAPQHSLVILDDAVGHYPQWEDPDSTLQQLTHFLDHLTPP